MPGSPAQREPEPKVKATAPPTGTWLVCAMAGQPGAFWGCVVGGLVTGVRPPPSLAACVVEVVLGLVVEVVELVELLVVVEGRMAR
jgi:hypothetical protein